MFDREVIRLWEVHLPITKNRTTLSYGTRSPDAAVAGASLAIVLAGAAIVVDGAAETWSTGRCGARAELAMLEAGHERAGEDGSEEGGQPEKECGI